MYTHELSNFKGNILSTLSNIMIDIGNKKIKGDDKFFNPALKKMLGEKQFQKLKNRSNEIEDEVKGIFISTWNQFLKEYMETLKIGVDDVRNLALSEPYFALRVDDVTKTSTFIKDINYMAGESAKDRAIVQRATDIYKATPTLIKLKNKVLYFANNTLSINLSSVFNRNKEKADPALHSSNEKKIVDILPLNIKTSGGALSTFVFGASTIFFNVVLSLLPQALLVYVAVKAASLVGENSLASSSTLLNKFDPNASQEVTVGLDGLNIGLAAKEEENANYKKVRLIVKENQIKKALSFDESKLKTKDKDGSVGENSASRNTNLSVEGSLLTNVDRLTMRSLSQDSLQINEGEGLDNEIRHSQERSSGFASGIRRSGISDEIMSSNSSGAKSKY